MIPNSSALPGATSLAQDAPLLPVPASSVLRRLRAFLEATGLAYDASIGTRDQRLKHCVLSPGAGLVLAATQASAPLLQANCAAIANATGLHVLLLRFIDMRPMDDPVAVARACLIRHDPDGSLSAHEG